MRRTLAMLGVGVLAAVGLAAFGFFVLPYISLWMWFVFCVDV